MSKLIIFDRRTARERPSFATAVMAQHLLLIAWSSPAVSVACTGILTVSQFLWLRNQRPADNGDVPLTSMIFSHKYLLLSLLLTVSARSKAHLQSSLLFLEEPKTMATSKSRTIHPTTRKSKASTNSGNMVTCTSFQSKASSLTLSTRKSTPFPVIESAFIVSIVSRSKVEANFHDIQPKQRGNRTLGISELSMSDKQLLISYLSSAKIRRWVTQVS